MPQAVNDVLSEGQRDIDDLPDILTQSDILCIQTVVHLLEPLAELTDEWQSDGVTSSLVIAGLLTKAKGNRLKPFLLLVKKCI